MDLIKDTEANFEDKFTKQQLTKYFNNLSIDIHSIDDNHYNDFLMPIGIYIKQWLKDKKIDNSIIEFINKDKIILNLISNKDIELIGHMAIIQYRLADYIYDVEDEYKITEQIELLQKEYDEYKKEFELAQHKVRNMKNELKQYCKQNHLDFEEYFL